MKRFALATALALVLSACAAPPTTQASVPISGAARGGVVGFGTLASFGSWEMELAPSYTRLASLVHRAATRLDAGRISGATAFQIQGLAVRAKAALNASRRGLETVPTEAQRQHLADARALIEQINDLLEE